MRVHDLSLPTPFIARTFLNFERAADYLASNFLQFSNELAPGEIETTHKIFSSRETFDLKSDSLKAKRRQTPVSSMEQIWRRKALSLHRITHPVRNFWGLLRSVHWALSSVIDESSDSISSDVDIDPFDLEEEELPTIPQKSKLGRPPRSPDTLPRRILPLNSSGAWLRALYSVLQSSDASIKALMPWSPCGTMFEVSPELAVKLGHGKLFKATCQQTIFRRLSEHGFKKIQAPTSFTALRTGSYFSIAGLHSSISFENFYHICDHRKQRPIKLPKSSPGKLDDVTSVADYRAEPIQRTAFTSETRAEVSSLLNDFGDPHIAEKVIKKRRIESTKKNSVRPARFILETKKNMIGESKFNFQCEEASVDGQLIHAFGEEDVEVHHVDGFEIATRVGSFPKAGSCR
jgi:hypothetical protein